MIHDIDLVLSLEPGRLEHLEAHGIMATGGHEDAVRARLVFSSGLIADLSASRIHPTLRRSTSLWSPEGMASVDFNSKTVDLVTPSADVRSGRFVATAVPFEERTALKEAFFKTVLPVESLAVPDANAIACEHDDFLEAVRTGRAPTVPASAGAAALEIANRVIDTLVCTRLGTDLERPTVPLPGPSGAEAATPQNRLSLLRLPTPTARPENPPQTRRCRDGATGDPVRSGPIPERWRGAWAARSRS